MILRPTAAATRGFTMVSFTEAVSRGNTFVGGTCAPPSALLVLEFAHIFLAMGLAKKNCKHIAFADSDFFFGFPRAYLLYIWLLQVSFIVSLYSVCFLLNLQTGFCKKALSDFNESWGVNTKAAARRSPNCIRKQEICSVERGYLFHCQNYVQNCFLEQNFTESGQSAAVLWPKDDF